MAAYRSLLVAGFTALAAESVVLGSSPRSGTDHDKERFYDASQFTRHCHGWSLINRPPPFRGLREGGLEPGRLRPSSAGASRRDLRLPLGLVRKTERSNAVIFTACPWKSRTKTPGLLPSQSQAAGQLPSSSQQYCGSPRELSRESRTDTRTSA